MERRNLFIGTLALFGASTLARAARAAADAGRYGKQKVVYQINGDGGPDSKKYVGALRNIQNHVNAVGAENLTLAVVSYGNGISLLKEARASDTLQTAIASLKGQNVRFNVCNNTLTNRKISYSDDLYDVWEEDIVPSGVAELAHLQQMGYAYIKP